MSRILVASSIVPERAAGSLMGRPDKSFIRVIPAKVVAVVMLVVSAVLSLSLAVAVGGGVGGGGMAKKWGGEGGSLVAEVDGPPMGTYQSSEVA